MTDQNNKVTSYAYDDADRLISVTDAANQVTTYVYDTENDLTDIYDAKNNHTHFGSYVGGAPLNATFPSGYSENYSWDGTSTRLQWKSDRNGNTTNYYYDYQDRLARIYGKVLYTYDAAGRLTQVSDYNATGTYNFAYDDMNRLKSATTDYSFDSHGAYTVQYGYDAASNRTSMTDPQSGVTSYTYDSLNRLTNLQDPSSHNFGFSYDALSRRTQLTRPNGVNSNYSYDNLSRLLSVLHQVGSTTLDGASYTYDSAGNRTAKTDHLASVTSNYTYDALYQLTGVAQGTSTTESYSYDAVGNRLSSLGVSPYAYNSSNELTSTPSATYTYDHNGNTKTKVDTSGTTTYNWNSDNQLTSVVLPASGGTVSFKYDPFGRRVQKSSSSGTTNYLYDGSSLVEEVDNSGNVLARNTQTLNMDEPLAELRGSSTSYYEQDAQGTVTSLSNTAGGLTSTYSYGSFGKLSASSGSVTNSLQYVAREFDSETGLYFNRARYYQPNEGRFLSEDSLSFDGGSNFYLYAANNPANLVDLLGLMPKGKDNWYGYNDPHFHKWFHRCWKQPGDPDATKPAIEEAYAEWENRNKPQNGNCWNGPSKNCKQKTQFELNLDQQSAQYMVSFWEDILVGDAALLVVGTAGALGGLGGGAAGGSTLAPPTTPPGPIPVPAPPPLPVPLRPAA